MTTRIYTVEIEVTDDEGRTNDDDFGLLYNALSSLYSSYTIRDCVDADSETNGACEHGTSWGSNCQECDEERRKSIRKAVNSFRPSADWAQAVRGAVLEFLYAESGPNPTFDEIKLAHAVATVGR